MFRYCTFLFFIFLSLNACSVFQSVERIKPIEFDYGPISKNYFSPDNDKPFPLTVQRGNNLYNSTTKDGRYLFYTTGQKGNYDIWFRDLKSSIVVPITEHPSSEYKPAISPDGNKLVFVSEQFDSSGDIVFFELDPDHWVKRILEGQRFLNDDFKFITNAEYNDPSKSDRYVDTDPTWSPDNRRIVFSSDRLSPGIPNLVLWDTEEKESPKLLTKQGAASPYWSADGKTILYLSYSDNAEGEIYSLDIVSGKTKRLTNDSYLDFSPSLSPDGKYLYYTSIRKDSDGNRKLDERDNSTIIRLDLSDFKERRFSSGNFSLFDTKYSSFNGGSILFTASFYGTLNIYFLPVSGSIPKATDISSQFQLAKEYGEKQTFDDYLLALDSLDLYFKEDSLYPIYRAKVLYEKYFESKKIGKSDQETKKELLASRLDPKWGLAYAYYLKAEGGGVKVLREYLLALEKIPGVDEQVLGELTEEIGSIEEREKKSELALRTWEGLSYKFPNYYRSKEIVRKIGSLQLREGGKKGWKISDILLRSANDPNAKIEDLRNLYELFESQLVSDKSDSEKIDIAEKIETVNSFSSSSQTLQRFFLYIKALGLNGKSRFVESNSLLDPFAKGLKLSDPLYYKIHLLRSENFRGLGDTKNSLEEFRTFLENYDHRSGVSIDDKEMERFFIYFENLARNYENRSDFEQAALHYFYNTLNMFIAKSKNLFEGSVYKDYAVYYEKLMIETSFKYAKSISEKNAKGLLGNLRALDYDPLDRKRGLVYLEEYFEKQPTVRLARGNLDLATLYGYSYYLINRSVIRETYYYNAGTIDTAKKEEALRDYKQAEYELRWIIFADPTYHEAYQLLGWLYQYVDIMKSRRPGDQEPTDEETYKDEYAKYFPEKNFEENIELYSQILELLGEGFSNKKVLSDLRLNLGNNYFLLKNYPKADEQYSLLETYSNYIISKAQFENYRQRAVFLFNSARSSMYMSKYRDAVRKLKIAAELYAKNEFLNLHTSSDGGPGLASYREKLGLIYTLTALSYMESGEYTKAIPYYDDALELNEPSRLVDPVNLRNALAICYQKLGEISKSEEQLKNAELLASQKGIRWFPRKVNPKFWDYFWELVFDTILPDSTRISGSGRFPEAIPQSFQPLLSSGIRVNNLTLEQNYGLAAEETNKRLEYIGQKSLTKTLAGQLIRSQSLGDLGYFTYKRNEFKNAKSAFWSGRQYEKKSSDLSNRTGASFKRYLYALFAEIESGEKDSEFDAEKDLNIALQELESVKKRSIDSCLALREDGMPESWVRCSENFYKEYYDYDILHANLLYYLGEENFKKKDWVGGFDKLGLASSLLEYPSRLPKEIIGLSKDPFSRKERVLHALSRASVYFRLGDFEKTNDSLRMAEEIANEFYLAAELIQTWVLQARLELNAGNLGKAGQKLKSAQEMLRKQFHIVSENKSFLLRDLFETKIRHDIESGNFAAAYQDWDQLQKLILFRSFQKGTWEFPNAQKEYSEFESDWKEFRITYQAYQIALETRTEIKKEEAELNRISSKVLTSLQSLKSKLPERSSFLDPLGETKEENLSSGETEFRLLEVQGKVYVRIRNQAGIKYLNFSGESQVFPNLIVNQDWKSSSRKIFDPGNTRLGPSFSSAFPGLVFRAGPPSESKTLPFIPKAAAGFEKLDTDLAYRKANGTSFGYLLEDSDILISEFPEIRGDSYFGEKKEGRLNLSEIFSKPNRVTAAILTYSDIPNWSRIQRAATALLGSGLHAVFLCPSSGHCVKEILEEIRTGKESSFGIRFGKLPSKGGNHNQEAEKLFVKAREAERRANYSESFENLHKARSLATPSSDIALKIESDLLRIYRRLNSDLNLEQTLGLRYEKRSKDQILELGFALCLAALLDTKDKDCKGISLSSARTEIINSIISLKSGIDPGGILERKIGSEIYDPFLYRIGLFFLALETYFPKIASTQLILAKVQIISGEDSALWALASKRLHKQIVLLEETEELSEKENFTEQNIWDQERNYSERLFFLQKKKRMGARISPLNLYSEIYDSSSSLFESLDLEGRSSVLDLLRYSLPEETGKEMSEFLIHFTDYEKKQGNLPRAARMMLEISKSYFSRGDYEKSKLWISKSEEMKISLWNAEISFLKAKLNLITAKPSEFPEDIRFTEYSKMYMEASRLKSKEFLDLANRWLKSRKNQNFTPRERRELTDFLNYLQFLSFKQNDSETFFDLCIAKDRISATRTVLLGRAPLYSDIPRFVRISSELEEKIPDNQEFLAVVDSGLNTFYIKFTKGKSNGELAFKDNRKIRASIARYNEEMEKGGGEVLLREAVETEIRQNIRLSKNKTTYLYLSSYYFLSPILPKSEEDIFYVTDPESLLKNPIHKEREEFLTDFWIQTKDLTNSPDWHKQLLKLENFELSYRGKQNQSPFHLFREPLFLDREKGVLYGSKPVAEAGNHSISGVWMLSSSFLEELRNGSDNLKDSLYYLSKQWKGTGIVNLGFQADTHNARFLKEIVSRKEDAKTSLRSRFLKTMEIMKEFYPVDKYWNGYRLFTTSFIMKG